MLYFLKSSFQIQVISKEKKFCVFNLLANYS